MLRRAAAGVLVALLMIVSDVRASADPIVPPDPGTGVSCPNRHCGVGAVDPGTAGTPGAGPVVVGVGKDTIGNSSGTGGDGDTGPACTEQPMSPQPAAESPWWEGHTAEEGQVVQWVCTGGLTPATCLYCTVLIPHFAANGT